MILDLLDEDGGKMLWGHALVEFPRQCEWRRSKERAGEKPKELVVHAPSARARSASGMKDQVLYVEADLQRNGLALPSRPTNSRN